MTILVVASFATQVEWSTRIIVAAFYGMVIGCECTIRRKSAGVRIHIVAAAVSALFMITSKYDFCDLLTTNGVALDPSRITAQTVTGTSFIGAGTILVRREQISGLTTAASVRATSAISMAVGFDLHTIGVLATIFIFFTQMLSYDDSIISGVTIHVRFSVQIVCANTPNILNEIQNELKNNHAESTAIKILGVDDKQVASNADGIINDKIDENDIIMHLRKYPDIKRTVYTHDGR